MSGFKNLCQPELVGAFYVIVKSSRTFAWSSSLSGNRQCRRWEQSEGSQQEHNSAYSDYTQRISDSTETWYRTWTRFISDDNTSSELCSNTLQALFSSEASLEALSKNSTLIFLQLLMRLVSSAQACILILNPFHNIIVVLIVNLPLHHHLQSVLSTTQTETFPFSSATPLPGRELDGVRQGWGLGRTPKVSHGLGSNIRFERKMNGIIKYLYDWWWMSMFFF